MYIVNVIPFPNYIIYKIIISTIPSFFPLKISKYTYAF